MAVITAFELDDAVATGESAGEADGRHGGFGARTDQPHHLDRWQEPGQQLRHFEFALGRCAEGHPRCGRGLHRFDHFRMGVAKNHRAPGTDVVDVGRAIGIPDPGPLASGEEARGAADRAEGTNRRIDASGDHALAFLEKDVVAAGHRVEGSGVGERRCAEKQFTEAARTSPHIGCGEQIGDHS